MGADIPHSRLAPFVGPFVGAFVRVPCGWVLLHLAISAVQIGAISTCSPKIHLFWLDMTQNLPIAVEIKS